MALRADGPDPRLLFHTTTSKITADVLPDFLCTHVAGLPDGKDALTASLPESPPRLRTIVLDNASAHVSQVVKAAGPQLEGYGITLYYLPPCSPELNRIERVWRSRSTRTSPSAPISGSKNSRSPSTRPSPTGTPDSEQQQPTCTRPLRMPSTRWGAGFLPPVPVSR
ncbi:transposase [Kitasatospora arboriphila]